jgi:hypothetical protein
MDWVSRFKFVQEHSLTYSDESQARTIERAGADAKLRFKAHPHMLCPWGFALTTNQTIAGQFHPVAADK